MILSSNYNRYESYFHEQAFQKMKENGYGACDYVLYLCKSPLDRSDEPSFAEIEKNCERLRVSAASQKVKIFQTHAGFYFDSDCYDKEYADAYTAHTMKQIVMTKLMGAKYMVVHPVQPYRWNDDLQPEKTEQLNVEILKRLSEKAEREGVVLALENMPARYSTIPCAMPERLIGYVDKVNSEYLKICLDTGHANIARNCRSEGKVPTCGDYVRAFGKRIVCLHLHENDGKTDQHNMPDTTMTGAPDWNEIFAALKETSYSGTLNSEASFSARLPEELFNDAEKLQAKLLTYYADKYDL